MKLTTKKFDLKVNGLCFEVWNQLTGEANCVGFDSLTVNETLEYNSIDELQELAPANIFEEIKIALDATANDMAEQWRKDSRELRAWLASI